MNHRERMILACAAIVGIFVIVQVGALTFVEPAQEQGLQETEDGGDASLSIAFVIAILIATAGMLALLKYGGQSVLRAFIILASVYISFFVFDVLVPALVEPTVGGIAVNLLAVGGALGLGAALFVYPEWYVIDGAGIVMGIGAAGLFGINFGVFPAIVLLIVLAIYDAISVYGTKHMLTLASGVMEMRVPVVLVVPLSLSYSFLDADTPTTLAEETDDPSESSSESGEPDTEHSIDELNSMTPAEIAELPSEWFDGVDGEAIDELDDERKEAVREALPNRDAMFIGLGDAIIPTVLVASVASFVQTDLTVSVLGLTAPLPAVTAMVGTVLGLVVLLWMVTKGRAHAGLPLLNGGAIGGYLLGALISGMTLAEALGISGVV